MKPTIVFLAIVFLFSASPPAKRINYIKKNLAGHGFSKKEINKILSSRHLKLYQYQPNPPKGKSKNESIDWNKLAQNITSKKSVLDGRKFIRKHLKTLISAENKFGVPKEDIAAVLRIETDFGRFLGSYEVANLFYNQIMAAKNWQKPADNFVALFVYCRNLGQNCFSVKGSYAGAFGLCQFLPSSAIKYGVDGNGDGSINLFNTDDAIMSAANFLAKNGWSKNPAKALGVYYGSDSNYPALVIKYATLLKR
ncbi:MAG: lytic murein transglycosylase [Patescibacteria group bacterium]|nr:lytic murein transglycosylase [Patescibacteria group bacterium]